jgi:hypothetical protein
VEVEMLPTFRTRDASIFRVELGTAILATTFLAFMPICDFAFTFEQHVRKLYANTAQYRTALLSVILLCILY